MDVDRLRQILKDKNLYVKENSKNIIAICPICGDHPNPAKKGHLWISTDPSIPVAHCFIGNHPAVTINQLIYDITGDKGISESIISKEEIKKSQKEASIKRSNKLKEFEIPELSAKAHQRKEWYIRKRSNNQLTSKDIPNLIFDFKEFFNCNHLQNVAEEKVGTFIDILQKNYIGIVTRNNTMLWCRNCDSSAIYKFQKIVLQESSLSLLDYIYLPGGDPASDKVVLAEGPFDIIGEYATDSLRLRSKARIYAAGLSFSYPALLKSVCYDETLFRSSVTILSDDNKKPYLYKKLKRQHAYLINKVKLFYNNHPGGDFGSFPVKPFEVRIA